MERLPGVHRVEVKLERGHAYVIYDDTRQTCENLAAAIDKLGFKASVKSVDTPVNALPFNGR